MALEAVVYPQDPFGYASCKEYLINDYYFQEQDHQEHKHLLEVSLEAQNTKHKNIDQQGGVIRTCNNLHASHDLWDDDKNNHSFHYSFVPSVEVGFDGLMEHPPPVAVAAAPGRRKRRRTRSSKNKEEIQSQRMTHIAVERNRRKQMNEYLAVLRSLMPPSYAQRGDQASIIGGAINFVKKLEQLLQSMEARKKSATTAEKQHHNGSTNNDSNNNNDDNPSLFSEFFTFPQYTTRSATRCATNSPPPHAGRSPQQAAAAADGMAEIEVRMVESHGSLKILSKRRPRQLLRLVGGLESLRVIILHLSVTTIDQFVLYSVSIKVEEGSQAKNVDDIAAAVNQMLRRIEEESYFTA